jgi:hypothetical protein
MANEYCPFIDASCVRSDCKMWHNDERDCVIYIMFKLLKGMKDG